MPDNAEQHHFAGYPRDCVNPYTEALVLLQVFGEPDGCPRAQLAADLDDLDPTWVSDSIASLEKVGVVVVKDARLYPSEQLSRLVALSVICF